MRELPAPLLFAAAVSAVVNLLMPFFLVSSQGGSDRDSVVAEIRILAPTGEAPSRPAETDYLARVERVIRGCLPGRTVTVRIPDALLGTGLGPVPSIAPHDLVGGRALVLLRQGTDRTFRVLHLVANTERSRQARPQASLTDLAVARPPIRRAPSPSCLG